MVESAKQLENVRPLVVGRRQEFVGWDTQGEPFRQTFSVLLDEAQTPLVIAQIEHIRAVENLNSILEVKGLDGILIGPYDLSASMDSGRLRMNDFKRPCKTF